VSQFHLVEPISFHLLLDLNHQTGHQASLKALSIMATCRCFQLNQGASNIKYQASSRCLVAIPSLLADKMLHKFSIRTHT